MKEHPVERPVVWAFWTLCVVSLCGLHEVAVMWLGIERALSPVMLLCCLVMLSGLLWVRPLEALGGSGMLLMAALVSYVGIGTVVAFAGGIEWRTDALWYLRRYTTSMLVVSAVAVGARIVLERIGGERTLAAIMAILTASCALMIASPWLLLVFPNAPTDGQFRYFGPFQNPNEAGFVACLAVVCAFSCLRAGRFTLMACGSLFVAVSALIGTFSRTAFVVLPVLVGGAIVVMRGAEWRRFAVGVVVVLWIAAGTLADVNAGLLTGQQIARLGSLLVMVESLSVDDITFAGRLTLWRIGGELALESPVYGHGLGRFHALEEAWYDEEGVLLGVHNQYLTLLGEAGVVPLLFFVLFLAGMLKLGTRRGKDVAITGAASGWAVVILITGLTAHSLLLARTATFILGVGCAAATFAVSRREGADENPAMASIVAPAGEHGRHPHSTVLSDSVPRVRGLRTSTV